MIAQDTQGVEAFLLHPLTHTSQFQSVYPPNVHPRLHSHGIGTQASKPEHTNKQNMDLSVSNKDAYNKPHRFGEWPVLCFLTAD